MMPKGADSGHYRLVGPLIYQVTQSTGTSNIHTNLIDQSTPILDSVHKILINTERPVKSNEIGRRVEEFTSFYFN